MEEKLKCLALVGAGALVGSFSTLCLLKLLPRASQSTKLANTRLNGNTVSEIPFTNDVVAPEVRNNRMPDIDLLQDEIVSTSSDRCLIWNTVSEIPFTNDVVAPEVRNNRMPDIDLLQDEIVSEQLTRNIQFFGLESQRKVTGSYVVVIGLGGVGTHAASMLLRSGVGKLLLVDFDQVSLSSLNRHAVATRADVGIPKAECLRKHFISIFPECHVEAKVLLYDASSEEEILSGHPDFVLDCIDNIDTKVALLAACVRRGLKVLSATGAGARADPTRIRVADLSESKNDPLSRSVRHRLRKGYGIDGGIPVVFSLEKPKAKLLPFVGSNGEDNPSEYQIVPGFRVRIIPVLGTIPAIFGQVMASYVVTQLAGLQVQTEPVVNLDLDHYRTLHRRLVEHEESLYGTAMEVQVDVEEVMYITKELWQGRSAREESAKDIGRGMWRAVNELMLVRWDRGKAASVSNLILLKFEEAIEHESRTLDDIKEKEPQYFERVTSILKRAEFEYGL